MKRRLSTAVLCAILAVAAPAAHGQTATWDPEEIARLSEKSAHMAEALSRAVEMLGKIDDLSRTIGRFGALSNLDFARLDVVDGLSGAGPQISGLAANVVGLQAVQIHSFADATAFIAKLTTVPSGPGQTTKYDQVRQALDALQRKAAEDGFALATHTRDSLALAPQRGGLLVSEAAATVDLRGDVGANTAANLAVLEQLASAKAILAVLLEIEASRKLGKFAPVAAAPQ